MDKNRLAHYKKKIEAKREELLRHIANEEAAGREADEEVTQDIADKATNSYTKEFLFSQSDTEHAQLQLVEDALLRVKNGDFGICQACEKPVQIKRLEAVPWTAHCIECQEKQEQGLLEATP